jgi:peroxiredoxin family protein
MSTTQIVKDQLTFQCIYSNNTAVAEQGQYFFESFWSLTILAKDRIRELEKGTKRKFIETIMDSVEIKKSMTTILKSKTVETMIIFSNTDDHNT